MTVDSPCRNLCKMNHDTGYCEGCFRSIDEITVWCSASDEYKRRVLVELAERRAAFEPSDDDVRAERGH
ncbi:MAG: DUF1289 domain-containing protein [Rhodocyclaceae bacterium]|nr:DUF1289 domain-containing protein [Rhodocyclaceae bacterium]